MPTLPDRFNEISIQMAAASARSGRSPNDVQLVAVSKTHPPEAVREAMAAGLSIFGENRVQEAKAKIPLVGGKAHWHFIGHLQKNKIRQALPLFDLFHGIDSLEIARDINRIAGELGLSPKILLEVNVAGESTKFGFRPSQLLEQVEDLLKLDRLHIDGLMAIPPPAPTPEHSRRYFVALRELKTRMQTEANLPLTHLSMGMSDDFTVAIEEGATLIRIGTALFGSRSGKTWRPSTGDVLDD
ncbi:MAG: YggS family pyridoxal phosphate-dependent enzyme [Verrucomicrobiota bacterium]